VDDRRLESETTATRPGEQPSARIARFVVVIERVWLALVIFLSILLIYSLRHVDGNLQILTWLYLPPVAAWLLFRYVPWLQVRKRNSENTSLKTE
jgi:hypothetical protein